MNATLRIREHERLVVGETRRSLDGRATTFEARHWDALARWCEFQRDPPFRVGLRSLQATHWVGVVRIGELDIEIVPKPASSTQQNDADAWRGALIDMLAVARKLRLRFSTSNSLGVSRHSLFDLYVARFLDEVEELLRQGLARRYREIEGQTKAFRGRLVTAQHARLNSVRRERFFVAFEVYDHDHITNAILHEALTVLISTSQRGTHARRARELLARFPEMGARRIDEGDFERLRLDRRTERYRAAIDLAWFVILRARPDLRAGRRPVLAMLFDMDKLFEDYVGELLRRASPREVQIALQEPKGFWRAADATQVRLRPDIVMRHNDGRVCVVDAKWKQPLQRRPDVADLRQMFTYNERWGAEHAVLMYPSADNSTELTRSGMFVERDHGCALEFVRLVERGVYDRERVIKGLRSVVERVFAFPAQRVGASLTTTLPRA